jgi:hypothetical protein
MLGCDAVVHAAAVFSLDPRQGAVMQQANPAGTATVLEAAQRHGLDPIVYVSTIGVFLPVTGPALTAGTPVGAGFGPCSRSKIAAELVARGSQQAGSPVVITYPAVEVAEVAALLGELTGRRLRQRTAPDWVIRQSGRVADRAQRLLSVRLPASAEQAALPLSIPAGAVVDDSATRQELAVERRELRETLAGRTRPGHRPPGRCPRRLTTGPGRGRRKPALGIPAGQPITLPALSA